MAFLNCFRLEEKKSASARKFLGERGAESWQISQFLLFFNNFEGP